MGSMGEVEINEVDVLIVGAGFGAATMLKKLLDKGFDVKVYEKGSSFGGMLESKVSSMHLTHSLSYARHLVLVRTIELCQMRE
jgi:cation diffusion facilitator CzcD-associated flavoprotein CzcO